MKKIFNIYHYCIYLILNKLHLFTNKINLAFLIFKLPYFVSKHKREKFDPVEVQNKLWMDRENGLNIWGADVIFGSSLMFLLLSLFLIVTKGKNIDDLFWPVSAIFIIASIFVTLKYGSNNGKYLKYYTEFELWGKAEKRKHLFWSILIILGIMVLFFTSLFFHFSSGIFRNL